MKRLLPALLGAMLFAGSLGVMAKADPTFGYPSSYSIPQDLNVVGLSATVRNLPSTGGSCVINVYGTFSATLDVYTSTAGTFIHADSTKAGQFTAAGTQTLVFAPNSGIVAIRVQNRAYTSGDPIVAIDCGASQLIQAGEPEPTPSATP